MVYGPNFGVVGEPVTLSVPSAQENFQSPRPNLLFRAGAAKGLKPFLAITWILAG